jgi:hypothetical protein
MDNKSTVSLTEMTLKFQTSSWLKSKFSSQMAPSVKKSKILEAMCEIDRDQTGMIKISLF